ncbi:MAG: hypothetical protein P4L84_30860 [Isosphaeraceae bacterium]|nr:hypothetical protein [Isosphaeraceae bacterium]
MMTARTFALAAALVALSGPALRGQEVEVQRPGPPPVEDFETDKNNDGVPDGWYNACDAKIAAEGGVTGLGPHCLRFESHNPGAPARLSRAFGVDGRKHEAIVIGLWIRILDLEAGERIGYDAGLIIDFLGEGLRQTTRGVVGPWTRGIGPRWTRVAKRIPVPPGTRDAIMSVGLLGALGVLEVDGITFDLVPVGGVDTTNLVVNGDFELGVPEPMNWSVEKGAKRAFPGYRSASALELVESGSKAMAGVATPIRTFPRLAVSLFAKGHALRGAGGAGARLFFLSDTGEILPGADALADLFRWSGTFAWHREQIVVNVPPGAGYAVFQVEKLDGAGSLFVDEVSIEASPDARAGEWTPYHIQDDTSGWSSVQPSPRINAGSALDASFLLDGPAGKHGFVTVREGRLAFSRGGRARFFGVSLLAPTAFLAPEKADALADRLARSGINLVRLGDLDSAIGPDRSLFDDSRDDTKAFDEVALRKLDHLIAALKKRGVYVALELQSTRRFRSEDGVKDIGQLPIGGGAAVVFDPKIGELSLASARALLKHVSAETGLALRDEPALAWVTLAGELSLFDLIDDPASLPPSYANELRAQSVKAPGLAGRRLWMSLESDHWKEFADVLRTDKLRVPIASASHWRREREFSEAVQAFDLVDDRLYWTAPFWSLPDRRSLLWSPDGGLVGGALRKRKTDKPYAVGQWAIQTAGAWALPHEGADVMLASAIAADEDWDALVRRGVFVHPDVWGSSSAGTGGAEDIYQIPEVINGSPQVFSVWPHAASLVLRSRDDSKKQRAGRAPHVRQGIEGWDPASGRLLIDTPYTQGVAGWPGKDAASFDAVTIETTDPFAVIVASSVGNKPLATADRILITALARIEPTGFRWVDEWRRYVADPGRPPLLQEPVSARIRWKRGGPIKAYTLDNTGKRLASVKLQAVDGGVELTVDGTASTLHWELCLE